MTQSIRFQNVVLHKYGRIIDYDTIYNALKNIERYQTFVVEMRDYLDSIGAFNN